MNANLADRGTSGTGWSREAKFSAAPSVRLLETEDGAMVLSLESDSYYALNRTGLWVWRRLVEGDSMADVATALAASAPVSEEAARAQIREFVNEASSQSLLRSEPG